MKCFSKSSHKKVHPNFATALGRQALKVARLQSEVWHQLFLVDLRISYEKCSENFPEMFELLFCGSKKIPQNSRQISRRISLPDKEKFNDEILQEPRENKFLGILFQPPQQELLWQDDIIVHANLTYLSDPRGTPTAIS